MITSLKTSAIALVVAMLAVAPAHALTLNLGGAGSGGLLNMGGSNTNPTVDVLTNGSGNNGAPAGTATTNALDSGGGPTAAEVTLGGTGGTSNADGNVLLDLFGRGDGSNAAVALGSGDGADGDAALDLFGNGGGTGGGANTGARGGSNGDPFGPTGGPASTGIRVASLDSSASTRCFAPDATQIARLANRHDYSDATVSGWVRASSISIISTGLCDSALVSISRDANVARLQAFIAGNTAIKSMLAKQGRSAGDVIAVDKQGSTLVVYVS